MWVKLDDRFEEHPKTYWIGAEGSAVQVWALSWCNRNRTKGFLPDPKVHELLDRATRTSTLTPDGLLHKMTTPAPQEENAAWLRVDSGYQIHDYTGYQKRAYDPDSQVSTVGTITQPSLLNAVDCGKPPLTTPIDNRAHAPVRTRDNPVTRDPYPVTRNQDPENDTTPSGVVVASTPTLEQIFAVCQEVMNGNGPRLFTKPRRALLRARLAEGFTVEQLKTVPHGWSRMPVYNGRVYGSFETLYRNAANVEMFLRAASSDQAPTVMPFKPNGAAARLAAYKQGVHVMMSGAAK